jgi:hypothetical protein
LPGEPGRRCRSDMLCSITCAAAAAAAAAASDYAALRNWRGAGRDRTRRVYTVGGARQERRGGGSGSAMRQHCRARSVEHGVSSTGVSSACSTALSSMSSMSSAAVAALTSTYAHTHAHRHSRRPAPPTPINL